MGLGKMTVFPQRLLAVMIYWTRHSFITSVAMKTYTAGSVILEFSQREPFLQKLVLCWPWTSLQSQGGESVLLGHLPVVGGINPFRKFWLLFSNPLSKFCVQLHLPPRTNEWTWWRSLRMQVAKREQLQKPFSSLRDVNFTLTDYWGGFPNQFGGFAMLKNMLIVLKTRNRALSELVPIPVRGQLASSGQLLIVQGNLAPFLAWFAQGKLPLFETNS